MNRIRAAISSDEITGHTFVRWLLIGLATIAASLAGIIWVNIAGQVAELRADVKSSALIAADTRVAVEKITARFDLLMQLMEQRKDSQANR